MGKINMGIFYGKKYNSGNRTFSLENGENFIEGTGHIHRVLQTIQMKLILICVLTELAILGSIITALKFKYNSSIG